VYTGHLGLALGAKGLKADAPLWMLVFAAQACDWAQAVACVAAPIGASAMWSHSVPAVLVLALALTVAAYARTRGAGLALVIGAVTVSHPLADYLTGWKPTWPGGPMIGLRLYGHPIADFVTEGMVILIGALLYARTLPTRRRPSVDVSIMLGALLVLQLTIDVAHLLMQNLPKC